MNEVRIKVMKGYKDDKASDEYYLLKKFNWLLFKIQKMKINMEDCLMQNVSVNTTLILKVI